MAFLVPSALSGFGSGYLAAIMKGGLGQVALKGMLPPTFGSAFTYGIASSLASRGIEYMASELCNYYQLGEKETITLTIAVIALQMFSSYEIANQLGKRLDVVVPRNFIHLENVLFMASVLEVDFDMTVHRINSRVWTNAVDGRLPTQAWGWIQAIYHEIANNAF